MVKPDDHVDCQNGSINVFGMKIHDHERLGVITIAEAYAHSSDVAAIKVGMKLGDERLYHYIKDYGFGQQTGIELPGETRGLDEAGEPLVEGFDRRHLHGAGDRRHAAASHVDGFDHRQRRRLHAAANRRRRAAAGQQGAPVVFHPAQQHRVVSTMTAAQMKKMMEGVVLFGTARRAILDGYTVAGKTGTAQKVDPATGAYSKTKYVASFVGFAPVNNPAITIAVILDSPNGLHQGGQVSAPVFKRIAQQVLEYLHVPHDVEIKNPQRQTLLAAAKDSDVDESSDRLGAPLQDEESVATKSPAGANSADSHIVAAATTSPAMNRLAEPTQPSGAATITPTQAPSGGAVVLPVDSGILVPSFLGKPLRSSVELAQQSGLEIEAVGSGVAREQSPAPGSRLPSGQKITVRFKH